MEVDNVFTSPCDTSVLYPTSGGNIHSFRAVTSCAVLDVLGPPYSDIEGRNCTYYSEYPYSTLPGNLIFCSIFQRFFHVTIQVTTNYLNWVIFWYFCGWHKLIDTYVLLQMMEIQFLMMMIKVVHGWRR